jgi:aryl-alcohol dehydrogenase-like predicted oxidoreductase
LTAWSRYCAQQGIAVCPYNVLQGGYLSGKYSQSGSAPADSRAVTKPAWAEGNSDIDGLWEKLGAIERAAAAAKRTMLQHTLVESLATVGITSLILGASRLEQVEQAVAALTASASL